VVAIWINGRRRGRCRSYFGDRIVPKAIWCRGAKWKKWARKLQSWEDKRTYTASGEMDAKRFEVSSAKSWNP
jgi:hypothetical protein